MNYDEIEERILIMYQENRRKTYGILNVSVYSSWVIQITNFEKKKRLQVSKDFGLLSKKKNITVDVQKNLTKV